MLQPLWNKLRDNNFIDKVSRVEANAEDFQIIMKRYNTADSFIYLDPPYEGREEIYDRENKGVFIKNDHVRLAKLIANSKARIALSYYHFDDIYKLYPKENYRHISKTFWNAAGNKKSDELLIMNY